MSDISNNKFANGDTPSAIKPPNRTETNRANAQNSTGPRTEAGKQRSSLNALRHGLTGQTVVLPSDDVVAYQHHCQEFLDQYQPTNKLETHLTQTIADLSWRLNRILAIETNMLAANNLDTENDPVRAASAMAKTFREQSQALANLSMYEHRLSNRFDKAVKQLCELQAERRHQVLFNMPKAVEVFQMHKAKGVPYNAIEDGFVFSEHDIENYIQRQARKKQASQAA
jgi:hypothetical protein